MIILPTIKTVIIQPPRTGSESVVEAAKARYADALHPFKHMELDGIPDAYAGYRKVGVFRHPADRLWSWYKQMISFAELRGATLPPFEFWMQGSDFSINHDEGFRHTLYDIPEARKSQKYYYTSQVGKTDDIELFRFDDLPAFFEMLDLDPVHVNETDDSAVPQSPELNAHLVHNFLWDLRKAAELS